MSNGPQDRVVRAAFWTDSKVAQLTATSRLAFLWLWCVADADGVAPYVPADVLASFGWDHPEVLGDPVEYRDVSESEFAVPIVMPLIRLGLVSTDYGPGEPRWIWVPGLPTHQPRTGVLKPERESDRPPPPHEVVVLTLRTRLGREPTQAECRDASPRSYGKKRKASGAPSTGDVALVWEAWRTRQQNPDACSAGAYRALIVSALNITTADNLVALVRYCYDADEPGPRWLRGDNPHGRKYLGLDNLLVTSKLPSRIEAALAWVRNVTSATASQGARAGSRKESGAAEVELGSFTTPEQKQKIMSRWRGRVDGDDTSGAR